MSHDSNELPASELGAGRWRKSSYSISGECVSVAECGDGIAVRNSNDPDAGTLVFTRAEIAAWIAGCKAGEFDDLA